MYICLEQIFTDSMRIKLTLEVDRSSEPIIPLNYQYELSSWIYRTLNYGDSEFSEYLHKQGYVSEQKSFKLFTFSHLQVPKFRITDDRMKIRSREIALYISFLPIKAIESFISGIFKKQSFSLGDRRSRCKFTVRNIEKLPEVVFSDKINYRCLSPVFMDFKNKGKKHPTFLRPDNKIFPELLFGNLQSKLLAHQETGSIGISSLSFKVKGAIRKKGILIKSGTEQQTKLIGYMFDFELQAPPELQRIGYYAGFGRLNSQGFGCCKILS